MKKKLLALLSVSLLLVLCLTPLLSQAMTYYDKGYYYVNTNDTYGLKLRTSPEKAPNDANLIVKIPHGAYVLVYEFDKNKQWAYVEVSDPRSNNPAVTVKGWCMTSFLLEYNPGPIRPTNTPNPHATATPAPGPSFDDINSAARAIRYGNQPYPAVIRTHNVGNYVHLRWFPSTSASYIEKYLAGEPVTVLAESSYWAQVMVDDGGYVGFILRDNIQPIPTATPEPVVDGTPEPTPAPINQ